MKVKEMISKVTTFGDKHQREIKLGLTIAGVVLTGISAARAGIKAHDILEDQKEKMDSLENYESTDMSEEEYKEKKRDLTLETVKRMAPVVLPPVVIGGATILSAVSGYSSASKQIAALSAAYSISEKTLTDFQDKAKEMLGDKNVRKVKDAINEDKVAELAPTNSNIIHTGGYHTPCFDVASGRYFYSSAERIRQACNNVNHQIMDEYFVSLNELYDDLGLPPITLGEDLGFTIDGGLIDIDSVFTAKPMEINGSTEPVLIFNIDEYISTKYMENRGRIAR